MSTATTVLVLRALGLGDLLAAVPALRGLRNALPTHHLTLAGPASIAALLHEAGLIDECVEAAGLAPLDAAPVRPDLAVNLHGRGPQSHRLLLEQCPAEIVAYACPEVAVEGPTWDGDEHERARWCRLVTSHFGVATDPDDVRLPPPRAVAPRARAVVIHPGAGHGARRWPPDRWAAVARTLSHERHAVVVTGSAAERDLAVAVAERAGLPPESVLAGTTGVRDLAALIASADLLVSGDTGVAHLASAYGTRSVLLFGPTPPALWGPPSAGPHRVLWRGSRQRPATTEEVDEALLQITASEVIEAACSRLAAS